MTFPEPSSAPTTPTKKNLRILYADDTVELCDVVKLVLARDGHVAECVSDGREALTRLTKDFALFDLVITDHIMPNMEGVEFVTRLRKLPYKGKVIVFSSELGQEVSETYEKLKVDKILYKPVFPTELRQVIADLYAPKR